MSPPDPRPGTTMGRIAALERDVLSLITEFARLCDRLDALDGHKHDPPERDPASTTNAVTERAWQPTTQAPAQGRAFGFAPPAYVDRATVDEGYRDEKWQDAQT